MTISAKKNRTKARKELALSREQWVEEATRALADGGLAAVNVEALARRLGVTKGSFYWHFPNRDALLEAVLQRWEAGVATMREELFALPDPAARLRAFFERPLSQGADERQMRLEVSIASAAPHDRTVAAALQRVTQQRIEAFVEIYRALGLPAKEARAWAFFAFSTATGLFQAARVARPRKDARRFLSRILDRVLPR